MWALTYLLVMTTTTVTVQGHGCTHSQVLVVHVWVNMEITLEYEEIHQVTKYYDANLKKNTHVHTPQTVSKREAVVKDLKSNCSEIVFETKGVAEPH